MREEPLHNEDAHRTRMRIRERELQAARNRVVRAGIGLVVHVSPPMHTVVLELIDAKVELALLERGGG